MHLAASVAVAALAAALVFLLWYPAPYRDLSGGRELFTLIVVVDVILGPLITFAVFNRAKPAAELRRDLIVVVLIQMAALAYGLWAVAAARPVQLVFEIDRFRVVHALDIPDELITASPPGIVPRPWGGPGRIAVRPFRSAQEQEQATLAALQGVHLGARPDLWEPYDRARPRVTAVAIPLRALLERMPQHADAIRTAAERAGRPVDSTAYLPLVARKNFWTVLLDPATGDILGYVPIDPY